ncbi:MAG: membrane protein insertion efficiency factor YidD, partial [candidate division WOR-3 bacterium]
MIFYKRIISPLQGQQICNFSPTCSEFARQSIRKYGLVLGTLMTSDRLQRCNPWAWTYLDKYYFGIENDRIKDP